MYLLFFLGFFDGTFSLLLFFLALLIYIYNIFNKTLRPYFEPIILESFKNHLRLKPKSFKNLEALQKKYDSY